MLVPRVTATRGLLLEKRKRDGRWLLDTLDPAGKGERQTRGVRRKPKRSSGLHCEKRATRMSRWSEADGTYARPRRTRRVRRECEEDSRFRVNAGAIRTRDCTLVARVTNGERRCEGEGQCRRRERKEECFAASEERRVTSRCREERREIYCIARSEMENLGEGNGVLQVK